MQPIFLLINDDLNIDEIKPLFFWPFPYDLAAKIADRVSVAAKVAKTHQWLEYWWNQVCLGQPHLQPRKKYWPRSLKWRDRWSNWSCWHNWPRGLHVAKWIGWPLASLAHQRYMSRWWLGLWRPVLCPCLWRLVLGDLKRQKSKFCTKVIQLEQN